MFQSVSINPVFFPDRPNTVNLVINVTEKDPGLIKFGFGYKNERGLRVFGSLVHNNIGGMNRTAYIKGELNQQISRDPLTQDFYSEYLTQFGFIEPWLFNSRDRLLESLMFRGDILFERRDTKSYRIDFRRQLSLSLEKELSKYGDLKLSYLYEKDFGYNKVEDKGFSQRFAILSPVLELDHRDNPYNPTKGAFNKFVVEYASPELDSNFHFYKVWLNSNVYFPIFKTSVFAASFRSGTSKAFSEDETGEKRIPILFRYFLGGRSTVRGYAQDSLGPKKNGRPLGGDHFINYKVELRVSLTKTLGSVFFLDGGNVYTEGYSTEVRHSWGTGLRYKTPIGPISLEYGVKVNPDVGERRSAVHFSIGTF